METISTNAEARWPRTPKKRMTAMSVGDFMSTTRHGRNWDRCNTTGARVEPAIWKLDDEVYMFGGFWYNDHRYTMTLTLDDLWTYSHSTHQRRHLAGSAPYYKSTMRSNRR
eukprot:g31036.t1